MGTAVRSSGPGLRAPAAVPAMEFDPAWNLTGRTRERLIAVADRLGN